ncbi:MAG: SDR family NAD(P)-dependent oxidoreductase [Leptospiraceae bacterium]|nr:SDR family NAD(P)-dependent oxidoreductase [Leptospiraceae bacterium]
MDKLVAVTGASRGIGEAIAKKFARENYTVILISRTETDLHRVQKEIKSSGGKAEYLPFDLSNPKDAPELYSKLHSRFGFIPNVVLNAGVSSNTSFENQDMANLEKELNVNYLFPIAFLKEFLPAMIQRKTGNIVSVGSVAAIVPFPGNSSYAATKSALLSLFTSLHLELKKHNVYAGSVLPGATKTDMTKDFHSDVIPFSSPQEIADGVLDAIRFKKQVLVCGIFNEVLVQSYRLFPEIFNLAIGTVADFALPSLKNLKQKV